MLFCFPNIIHKVVEYLWLNFFPWFLGLFYGRHRIFVWATFKVLVPTNSLA
jgi:hypothetical protein